MDYQHLNSSHAEEIASLTIALTDEIIERTGTPHFDMDSDKTAKLCRQFIEENKYTVLGAISDGELVGFAAICESQSLYAEGSFGIIQEFYVKPEYRSQQVGSELIEQVIQFAKEQNWQRLELCTPPVPTFDRSVSFYQKNGFQITGGYKMKYSL